VAFVAPQNRGWILDRIGLEAVAAGDFGSMVCYSADEIPECEVVFVTHYSLVDKLRSVMVRRGPKIVVWFTHPPDGIIRRIRCLMLLRQCHFIVSTSTAHVNWLMKKVLGDKLRVEIPGVDTVRFEPHKREKRRILFCASFYERKNPERILEIVANVPEERFVLLGSGWPAWSRWEELIKLPNFEYLDVSYEKYAEIYSECDIFVSTSKIEGGPVPLLEALSSNIFPIVTDTGFARDVLSRCDNRQCGLILSTSASWMDFRDAIRLARVSSHDVRHLGELFTWARFSEAIREICQGVAKPQHDR